MLHEQWKKLAQLANFLDDLPHSKFHMPKWCSPNATAYSCGTAGCAAGWAATIFNKEGWQCHPPHPLSLSDKYNRYGSIVLRIPNSTTILIGAEAFAVFFGISTGQACFITGYFLVDQYEHYIVPDDDREYLDKHKSYKEEFGVEPDDITPSMAAKRIRDVIRECDPTVLEEPSEKITCEYATV